MKTLHNLIMARWQEDFESIHNEQPMDAYTVSGFIRSILMDNEGEVQFREPSVKEFWREPGMTEEESNDAYTKDLKDLVDKVKESDTVEQEEIRKENAELRELVLDLFAQGCGSTDGKYDHCCLSTYEAAQDFLIDKGIIKKEDCYRR